MYNPVIGKFLSVDPLTKSYPWYTPYQFAGNTPIQAIDLDGLEEYKVVDKQKEYLHTLYKWGGKNPSKPYIGMLESMSLLKIKQINAISKDLYKIGHKQYYNTESTNEKKYDGLLMQKHAENLINLRTGIDGNKKYGIDCSGLFCKGFNNDETKLMANMNTGTADILEAYSKATEEGKGFLHTNFNQISQGDALIKRGHVMTATGNIKVDKDGNVTDIEVIHSYEKYGVNYTFFSINSLKKYKIGHTFRTTDKYIKAMTPYKEDLGGYNKIFNDMNQNKKQTVVNDEK